MSTIVRCKGCGKQLRLSERMAGRRVECPACRTTISVPEAFSSPNSDNLASESAGSSEPTGPATGNKPKSPSRKLPGSSTPASSAPTPATKPTSARAPKPQSADGSPRKKPAQSPGSPPRAAGGRRTPSAQSSDDPFDLSASATASGADLLGTNPVAEAPFSAVSISSGGPTGKTISSRTARRSRGKKNQSQKLMLQCGIGFGVFLVLAAAILLWPRDDNTDSLKQLVYQQFYDCEDEKLLKKLVEKHHKHCVDACTDPDEKTVDGKKYEKMMRKRVAKDLRAEGLHY